MNKTMRAAVYRGNRETRLEERPIPKIGPGELLVRVRGCGLCATDVSKVDHALVAPPAVLGHEVVGTVASQGEGTGGFTTGQRVVVSHHVPCYACHYCKHGNYSMCRTFKSSNIDPGGFAEYIRVPALNVRYATFPIPDALRDEEAAFTDPLACCLRAVKRLHPMLGDTVLVVGLGSIGLMLTQLLRLYRVRVVGLDPLTDRLERAKAFGAETALNPEEKKVRREVTRLTEDRGADAAILTAGGPKGLQQALELLRDGGTALLFASDPKRPGAELDIHHFFHRELTLQSSYSPSTIELQEALTLLTEGMIKVRDLVTHRVKLADLAHGMHLFREKGALKVFVEVDAS